MLQFQTQSEAFRTFRNICTTASTEDVFQETTWVMWIKSLGFSQYEWPVCEVCEAFIDYLELSENLYSEHPTGCQILTT